MKSKIKINKKSFTFKIDANIHGVRMKYYLKNQQILLQMLIGKIMAIKKSKF